MAVPLLGAAACTFFDNVNAGDLVFSSLFIGDGFDIGAITVSVESDPVEQLLGN